MKALLIDVGSTFIKYSFCGLHGVDGKSRGKEEFIQRITDKIGLLPKKKSVIVGGGATSFFL